MGRGLGPPLQEWGRRGFPGKGQTLLEEDKFEGMAPNTLGAGGWGTDRHVVLRDDPDTGLRTPGRAEGSSQGGERGGRGLGALWQPPLRPGGASWQAREPPLP